MRKLCLSLFILCAAVFGSLSAQAEILYGVAPSSDSVIAIDTATGAGITVGGLGIAVSQAGGTTDCEGTVWAFSRAQGDATHGILYTVDTATGAATVIQEYDLSALPSGVGIEFGPDGSTLYWRAGTYLGILNLDGTITAVNAALGTSGVSLARAKEGTFYAESNSRLVRLALDGTEFEDIGPTLGGLTSLSHLDGVLYGHAGGRLYTISKATGAATLVGNIGHSTPGTAFAVAQGCAPICDTALADVGVLWPPNHKLKTVSILGVEDPDGDPVTIQIDSVFQDESVDNGGDGNTAPDAFIAGDTADVRSERSGQNDGRVYHLGFTATDIDDNTCSGTVTVCAPHDRGRHSACVDQGPLFDSTVAP